MIGALTLSPAFNSEIDQYSAETSNATNTITATPEYVLSTVAVKVNGSDISNGTAATWQEGENEVLTTVKNGEVTKVYTVTVTKT